MAGGVVSQLVVRPRGALDDRPGQMSDALAQLRARYERLNLLYQVGNVIHATLEPQEALRLILNQAVSSMHATSGSVVLINPTNGVLEIHAAKGLPANATELKLRAGE